MSRYRIKKWVDIGKVAYTPQIRFLYFFWIRISKNDWMYEDSAKEAIRKHRSVKPRPVEYIEVKDVSDTKTKV